LSFCIMFCALFFHNQNINTFLLRWQFILFSLGCISFAFKDQIQVNWLVCLSLAVICLICYPFCWFQFLFWPSFVYFILLIGSSSIIRQIKLPGDYSYGVYIYGFFVQQIVNKYYPHTTAITGFLFSVPVCLLLSVLSWHFVEKDAIRIGRSAVGKMRTKV
jgi:peptidoglycan/LPS O-acetylase OafA/YrhL